MKKQKTISLKIISVKCAGFTKLGERCQKMIALDHACKVNGEYYCHYHIDEAVNNNINSIFKE